MLTNPKLSNAIAERAVILWQYDQSPNLIGLIDGLNGISERTVTDFWDYFAEKVMDIDNADEFGLEVWGRLLGLPRPTIGYRGAASETGEYDEYGTWAMRKISDDLYRRLLKGRFFMLTRPPTPANYNELLAFIFGKLTQSNAFMWICKWNGIPLMPSEVQPDSYYAEFEGGYCALSKTWSGGRYGRWLWHLDYLSGRDTPEEVWFSSSITYSEQTTLDFGGGYVLDGVFSRSRSMIFDNADMSMGFSFPLEATAEETFLVIQHPEAVLPYPAGIKTRSSFSMPDRVLGFDGQGLNGFAGEFAWGYDTAVSGGIVSGTAAAAYYEGGDVIWDGAADGDDDDAGSGETGMPQRRDMAFVLSGVGPDTTITFALGGDVDARRVCIDWGDGAMDFRNGVFSHSYGIPKSDVVVVIYNSSGVNPLLELDDSGVQCLYSYKLYKGTT